MKVRRHHRNALVLCCLGATFALTWPSVLLAAKESPTYERDGKKGSDDKDDRNESPTYERDGKRGSDNKNDRNDPDDPAAPPPDIGGRTVTGPAGHRSGKPHRRDVARAAPAPDKHETRAQRPVTGAVSQSEKANRIIP